MIAGTSRAGEEVTGSHVILEQDCLVLSCPWPNQDWQQWQFSSLMELLSCSTPPLQASPICSTEKGNKSSCNSLLAKTVALHSRTTPTSLGRGGDLGLQLRLWSTESFTQWLVTWLDSQTLDMWLSMRKPGGKLELDIRKISLLAWLLKIWIAIMWQ